MASRRTTGPKIWQQTIAQSIKRPLLICHLPVHSAAKCSPGRQHTHTHTWPSHHISLAILQLWSSLAVVLSVVENRHTDRSAAPYATLAVYRYSVFWQLLVRTNINLFTVLVFACLPVTVYPGIDMLETLKYFILAFHWALIGTEISNPNVASGSNCVNTVAFFSEFYSNCTWTISVESQFSFYLRVR